MFAFDVLHHIIITDVQFYNIHNIIIHHTRGMCIKNNLNAIITLPCDTVRVYQKIRVISRVV